MPAASAQLSPQASRWQGQLAARQLQDSFSARQPERTRPTPPPKRRPFLSLPAALPGMGSNVDSSEKARVEALRSAQLEEAKQFEARQKRAEAFAKNDPLNQEQRMAMDIAKKEGGKLLRGALNISGDGAGGTGVGLAVTTIIFVLRGLITRFTFLRESRFGELFAFQGRGIKDFVTYLEPTPKVGMIGTVLILFIAGVAYLLMAVVVLFPFIAIAASLSYIASLPGVSQVIEIINSVKN